MLNVPMLYDYNNIYNGTRKPSTTHATDTALAQFFQRYLLQDIMSVYKWTLPETWSHDYFRYVLLCWGFIAIINTDKYGVIPQGGSLYGYDVFYRPTNVTISNPLLKGILQPRIGVECSVIKLQPDYGGVMDIVSKYADLMAATLQTAGSNIVASKLAYVFTAQNKAGAESFKKMFDQISVGNAAVVQDAKLKLSDGSNAWEMFSNNLRNNYIAGDMMVDLQRLRNMFCTEIGIPNANTEKKERQIVDEVNSNNIETYSKASLWLEEIKRGIDGALKMFPQLDGKLAVSWRFEPEVIGNGDTVNSGTL